MRDAEKRSSFVSRDIMSIYVNYDTVEIHAVSVWHACNFSKNEKKRILFSIIMFF